nr:hypothetical protein [Pseudoruegeria sp. SHC-113]
MLVFNGDRHGFNFKFTNPKRIIGAIGVERIAEADAGAQERHERRRGGGFSEQPAPRQGDVNQSETVGVEIIRLEGDRNHRVFVGNEIIRNDKGSIVPTSDVKGVIGEFEGFKFKESILAFVTIRDVGVEHRYESLAGMAQPENGEIQNGARKNGGVKTRLTKQFVVAKPTFNAVVPTTRDHVIVAASSINLVITAQPKDQVRRVISKKNVVPVRACNQKVEKGVRILLLR